MVPLIVLYNSVCPVCREGICHFERRTRQSSALVEYVDVSKDPQVYKDIGVRLDDVRLKLHAILPGGELVRGWPAVHAIWLRTPGYGWLARLGNLPAVSLGSRGLYHLTAHVLWAWNRVCNRW